MINIAIFGSGNGSNFEAIAKAIDKQLLLNCQITFMHTNNDQAKIIDKAKAYNIPVYILPLKNKSEQQKYDDFLLALIRKYHVDLICLAGYMKILSKYFLDNLDVQVRVINIHPSLLPVYPGINSIYRAFQAQEKYLGVTIHYVNEGIDSGEIIAQVKVPRAKSLALTEKAIHQTEHELYVKILNQLCLKS